MSALTLPVLPMVEAVPLVDPSTADGTFSLLWLVVGLPLNLDGTESPRSQSTRAFARNVEALAPVFLWDERWSTQAVERQMIREDRTRAQRAALVDKMAAAYLLQGAIDAAAHLHA